MPCWTIQESRAEFGAKTDRVLFAKALDAMGYRASIDSKGVVHFSSEATQSGGRLELNGTLVMQGELTVNPFKRAYSAEVVKATAQRFGWKVEEKKPGQYQVTRRA